ncbi:hypothetical protein ACLB2K_009709 [Fragaria x ananassa]
MVALTAAAQFLLGVDLVQVRLKFMKYVKEEYARIGVMPRYGDAEFVRWFEVQTNCTFHILNCFEDDDQVLTAAETLMNGSPKGSTSLVIIMILQRLDICLSIYMNGD